MSQPELPPLLREQLARYDQAQQNLQAVLAQRQQVELELSETDKALEELGKASASEDVYKFAGNLLVKVKKEDVVKELNEKKELGNTRKMVLQSGIEVQGEPQGPSDEDRRRGQDQANPSAAARRRVKGGDPRRLTQAEQVSISGIKGSPQGGRRLP